MPFAGRGGCIRLALILIFLSSIVAIAFLSASPAAADNPLAPPEAITSGADKTATLYFIILGFALFVFIVVEAALIFAVLRFRRRDERLPPQVRDNPRLEVAWTVVPAVILLTIFVLSVQTLRDVQGTPSGGTVIVDVTARQWVWLFEYPQAGVSSTNELAVPVGETVKLRIRSEDVNHSFYVPQFLRKLDAIPGRVNEMSFRVDEVGTFHGQCAEFCGLGHAGMGFTVVAMEPSEFEQWLREQRQ